jgi:DNA-binding NarL/FixJ family response regulator
MSSFASAPIRVLVADDHPVTREGLALILARERDIEVVAQASNGREAVELYAALQPDIALLDLQMPQMTGAQAIETLIPLFPQARLIVLTTYDGDEDIYRSLHAGAKGYLLKDTPREELLRAVRSVHAGERYVAPTIGAKLADRVGQEPLSARELDVLRLLAEGKANKVIGRDLSIGEGTVRTHVTNLLAKLGASSRTDAVMIGLRRGILR